MRRVGPRCDRNCQETTISQTLVSVQANPDRSLQTMPYHDCVPCRRGPDERYLQTTTRVVQPRRAKERSTSRISIRNVRRDSIKDLRELEHEKLISEDDLKRGEEELQKITDDFIKDINETGERKEVEVMEV